MVIISLGSGKIGQNSFRRKHDWSEFLCKRLELTRIHLISGTMDQNSYQRGYMW